MLYFSKVGADPDGIDLDQLRKVKDFKKQIYPNALTESFKSQVDFRDKFARQLEIKVRDLQKVDNPDQPPPLSLGFRSANQELVRPTVELTVTVLRVSDLESFLSEEKTETKENVETAIRDRIRAESLASVVLGIRNAGASGVRNLYGEVLIQSSRDIELRDPGILALGRGFWTYYEALTSRLTSNLDNDDVGLRKTEKGWEFQFEWDALQPQRVRLIKPQLFIQPVGDTQIDFRARIFADSFPEPVFLQSALKVNVQFNLNYA
jgi:hypothetical protein